MIVFLQVIMLVSFICGMALLFGPDFLSFALGSIASFERLSWFSLIGTAALGFYWIFFSVSMYRYTNPKKEKKSESKMDVELVDISNDAENNVVELQPQKIRFFKYGTKELVIGSILTCAWIALFVTTDMCKIAASEFNAWREAESINLQVARIIGYTLIVLAIGMAISFFSLLKPRKRTRSKATKSSTSKRKS